MLGQDGIGFVAAYLQYTNTAAQAISLPLQQSKFLNNPGYSSFKYK